MRHNRQKIVVLINFPKKSPFQRKEESGPSSVQNNLILYLMICHRVFLKHFGMVAHDRLKKVVLVIFPQKSSFNTIVQFGPNMAQNYATICPRQLYLMIHSLKIMKCSMMGYNSQTNVLLVNLPKKFRFWRLGPNLNQTYATLCLMIYSQRIFLKFCGIMRHKRQTKLVLVIFPKIFFWGNMGLIWNLLSYDLLFMDFFLNAVA